MLLYFVDNKIQRMAMQPAHFLAVFCFAVVNAVSCGVIEFRNEPTCSPGNNYFAAGPKCNNFFSCRNGVLEIVECRWDFLWNDTIKRCDAPENVQCEDEQTPETTTQAPTTEAPTPAPTTDAPTPAPTTEVPTTAPTTEAPTPAPTTEAPTPAPTTEAPTSTPTTEAPTPAPTTEAPTPAPTTEAPTPAPTTSTPSNTFLPEVEGALPILFPGSECPEDIRAFLLHPTDCRRYYFCLYGVQYPQTCPFLELFNYVVGHCVPRDQSFCFPGSE
ncbi:threonine-rich protein-like isoform X1 [Anopheles merus]|uniref:threonine-rich protein-like isoform X1 n=1 Tax=Anopheles merus TaxID=30066 RepID=UPI001BE4751F|nr:threonine-rich protein-like isoform X1 [Anopheles merus]